MRNKKKSKWLNVILASLIATSMMFSTATTFAEELNNNFTTESTMKVEENSYAVEDENTVTDEKSMDMDKETSITEESSTNIDEEISITEEKKEETESIVEDQILDRKSSNNEFEEIDEEMDVASIYRGFNVLREYGTLVVEGDEEDVISFYSSEPGQNAKLTIGQSIKYDAWSTHVFHIESAGKSHIGYCANPSLQTPPAGEYTIKEIENDKAKAVMITNPWGPEPNLKFWDTSLAGSKNIQYTYAHAAIGYLLFGDELGLENPDARRTITVGVSETILDQISKETLDSYRMFMINSDNVGNRQSIVWVEKKENGSLNLKKESSNPDISKDNQCYSLDGALYGVYTDFGCTQKVGELKTNHTGETNILTGLKRGTYFVKEIQAPKGFLLDGKVHSIVVKENQTSTLKVRDEPGNDPVAVTLNKIDSETKDVVVGGASLAGAEFTFSFYATYDENALNSEPTRKWVTKTKEVVNKFTGKKQYKTSLGKEYLISGDKFYEKDGKPTLPLGILTIEETKAPEGYTLEGGYIQPIGSDKKQKKYIAKITKEGEIVSLQGGNEFSVPNQVVRGDLEGVKIAEGSHKRLANVKFKITAKSTGENHVLVTDKNGQFSTKRVAHSKNTNKGESYQDGVWFGKGEVNDSLGALPYDTYIIEELRGETNKKYDLIPAFEVSINENKQVINLGTLVNKPTVPPTLKTTALDKTTNSHVGAIAAKTIIEDTVNYKDVIVGKKYTVKGKLMIKEANKPFLINGKEVTAETTFIPTQKDGKVKLTFEVDSRLLIGKTIVVFEDMYVDGESVAVHADIEDEDQSVHYPKIGTTATVDGKKTATPERRVTLNDVVEYKNLVVGKEYTAKGKVMDKETGKVLLVGGKEVTAETTFKPSQPNGKIEVIFNFDGSMLDKKSVVIFEDLYHNGNLITSHADINDEGQTVKFEKKIGSIEAKGSKNTSSRSGSSVKTGDVTNISIYAGLLLISLVSVIYYKKRGRYEEK